MRLVLNTGFVPMSFEVFGLFSRADDIAREKGRRIQLEIVPGFKREFKKKIRPPKADKARRDNLVVPATELFDTIESVVVHSQHYELACDFFQEKSPYKTAKIFAMMRDGRIRGPHAPQGYIEAARPMAAGRVVIPMRDNPVDGIRNSSKDDWYAFGRWLMDNGKDVLFVRDTDGLHNPWPEDLPKCDAASRDVRLRMALYETADLVMGVSGGNMMPLWYRPDIRGIDVTKRGFKADGDWINMGLTFGASPPGGLWVRVNDTYDELRKIYETHHNG